MLLWWIDPYSKYLQVSCFEQRTGLHNLGEGGGETQLGRGETGQLRSASLLVPVSLCAGTASSEQSCWYQKRELKNSSRCPLSSSSCYTFPFQIRKGSWWLSRPPSRAVTFLFDLLEIPFPAEYAQSYCRS